MTKQELFKLINGSQDGHPLSRKFDTDMNPVGEVLSAGDAIDAFLVGIIHRNNDLALNDIDYAMRQLEAAREAVQCQGLGN